ncbi:MAG: PBECR2 nuclease fold domain-containing protein [Magnetococcus sp. DMHC-1]
MKKPCLGILPGHKTWVDYGRPHLAEVSSHLRIPAPPLLTAAESHDKAWSILADAVGFSPANPTRIVETPVEKVILRKELLEHVVAKRADARERYGNFLLPTLTDPYEAWLVPSEDGFRTRYIGLFQDMRDLLVVVRVKEDGSLFWNLIRTDQNYLNRQRTGSLLFGK